MGDDNKKSFWASFPGILTGIAAGIAALGGLLSTYYHITPSPSPSPSSSPSQQFVCGTQFPVTLFGIWRWSGTNNDLSQSGVFTFKSDSTYTDIAKAGFTTNDEGSFVVSSNFYSSGASSITLTNKASGEKYTYLITNISENSFHAFSPDYTVNLDFVKAS